MLLLYARVLISSLAVALFSSGTPSVPKWQTMPAEQPLPRLARQGFVEHDQARIWFGTVGKGAPVILLHGGLASSRTWGNQIPALVNSHHEVILIDSRGHGRSTLGPYPLSYERMQTDVVAVMDNLHIKRAALVGWSDGAIVSIIMAMKCPSRVTRIYAFGANMNTDGLRKNTFVSPLLSLLARRMKEDYIQLSSTPQAFNVLHVAVETMQMSQPRYTEQDLSHIVGPKIAIADGDHEEFITRDHTEYLARTIPGAKLVMLPNVSHFAAWQDPSTFNASMLEFLGD
ncbi:alpha/beta fold hydrolase [Acidicapsa ligni]|uniref:alpha/beta fold hydrolase n=1 Tax=Acidicapsa ligni TaxID=542300 RepID=UPI00295C09EA|nr:alpha/beta hydrolase [Acidicapsa ligni]